MAGTFGRQIGAATPADGTSSAVIATSAVANVGERIVVGAAHLETGTTITGVVDSAGNTYVKDEEILNGLYGAQWSAPVTAQLASGGTITVTYSSTSTTWRNLIAVALVGVGAEESSNSRRDDDDVWDTTATTAAAAGAVIVGFSAYRSGTDYGNTPATNITEVGEQKGGNINFVCSYRELGTSGSFNIGGTWVGASDLIAGVAMHAIYPDSGGGGGPVGGPTLRVTRSNLRGV